MTDPAGTDRSDAELVEELVFRCLEASDLHAAVAQCCAEHPQLADRVRRVLARLEGEQLVGTGSAGAPLCAAAIGDRELPERLGHFRILSRLGAGGMGVVYLAEDEQLARQVAVKLVRPEQLFFPGARERFRREIEAIARLHHPGIVTIHSVGEEHGMPFFAMDYVRGKSLAQVIAELAGTEPARLREQDLRDRIAPGAEPSGSTTAHGSWVRLCIELIRDLAGALQHAHEQGVVHRDVKPSNVLIGPDLRPRLLDFGLARADDSQQLTRSSSQLGSLPYMAPDRACGAIEGTATR